MSAHVHDFDLVAGLADGSLDPAGEAAARRAVAECERCRAELALQGAVRERLSHLPAVALTPGERHRLVTATAPARRRFLVPALAGVAAVVAVAVGLAGSLDREPPTTLAVSTEAPAAPVVDLGPVGADELAGALAELVAGRAAEGGDAGAAGAGEELAGTAADSAAPAARAERTPCDPPVGEAVAATVVAVVDGRDVTAFVVGDPPRALVLDSETCAPLPGYPAESP